MQTRSLLISMTALQVLWLTFIWWTGAATSWWKVPILIAMSLLCALFVDLLPACVVSRVRSAMECLARDDRLRLVVFIVLVMGVGSVYAFYQAGWPDEQQVFRAVQKITKKGVEGFFANYKKMRYFGRQHPPLAALFYGMTGEVFGAKLFPLRCVSLLLSLGTLLLTYRIGALLYSRSVGVAAAGFFLAMPFFFRVGTTALLDMPVVFCFVLAVWGTLCLLQRPSWYWATGIGLCIGTGLLCKYTMAFVYPVLLSLWLINGGNRRILPFLALIVIISASMLTVWLGYAAFAGMLTAQKRALTSYAGFVVRTQEGKEWLLGALFLRLPSGIGVANLPLLLVGGRLLWRRRSQSDLSILLWIALVFLPIALTLPGPRYFLPAFPALAIAMACGLEKLAEGGERVLLLALLLGGSTLYLFVDWYRAAGGLFAH